MKILMVKNNRMKRDGITSVIYNLIQAMDASSVCVDLVAINEPDTSLKESFEKIGVTVQVLPREVKRIIRYVLGLRRIMRQGKYDAVHIHGSSATIVVELLAAWLAGCQVRIAHSHSTCCKHKIMHHILKPVVKCLCTHRLACSEAAGKWLYGSQECYVIPNGVDTARFAFCEKKRRRIRGALGISEEDTVLGHIGMFTEVKNQGFLVELLKILPPAYRLVLVGCGTNMEAVRETAKDMGISDRISFIGTVDNPEEYYSAFDIMMLPSLYEGFPMVLVEAQASGLPCLVSDRVAREVDLTGNVRFLPICSGAEPWAAAIQQQMLLRRESASIAAINRIKAHGFDVYEQATDMADYYRRAIGSFYN